MMAYYNYDPYRNQQEYDPDAPFFMGYSPYGQYMAPGGYRAGPPYYRAQAPGSGGDANSWNAADRDFSYGTGVGLMNEYGEQAAEAGQGFSDAERAAYERAASDIAIGGVPDAFIADLGRYDDQLEYIRPDENDFAATHLSSEQKKQMMGDPDAGREYYQPDQRRAIFNETVWDQRGAAKEMREGMRGAAGQYASLGKAELADYRQRLGGIDANHLRLDEGFVRDYRMSPEMQQAIIERSARDMGAARQAQIDSLARRAAAQGIGALGVSAAAGRMQRAAAAEQPDAMLAARIGANREAASRLRDIEQMRQQGEGAALGFEVDRGTRLLDAGLTYADRATGYRMQAEGTGGSAVLDTERGIGAQRNQLEADLAREGYAQARAADDIRTGRYTGIADRDLQSGRDWYNMRAGAQQAISGVREQRQARVFDARQNNAAMGRQYQYSRPGMYSQRQMGFGQQRMGAYETAMRGGQAATQNRMQDELQRWQTRQQKGSFWGNLARGAVGAGMRFLGL
jgi:hypothetical protein